MENGVRRGRRGDQVGSRAVRRFEVVQILTGRAPRSETATASRSPAVTLWSRPCRPPPGFQTRRSRRPSPRTTRRPPSGQTRQDDVHVDAAPADCSTKSSRSPLAGWLRPPDEKGTGGDRGHRKPKPPVFIRHGLGPINRRQSGAKRKPDSGDRPSGVRHPGRRFRLRNAVRFDGLR